MRNFILNAPSYLYVVTKKPHRCQDCHAEIPAGCRVLRMREKLGCWHTYYYCPSCDLKEIEMLPSQDQTNHLLGMRRQDREVSTQIEN